MKTSDKICPLIFIVFLAGVLSASGWAENSRPDALEARPHFDEALEEARRRLAIIESVPPIIGTPIPIATGLFVTEDGGVITSITAVAGADKIFVKRFRERAIPIQGHQAQVKAVDQGLGIVFLETSITIERPFAHTKSPAVAGEWVITAYVNPTEDDHSFELGVFPAIVTTTDANIRVSGRHCESMIRLSSKTPEGSAAAPVFNSRGELEGLLIAIRDCSTASECSYVLPERILEKVVGQLTEGISNRIGWLGVALQPPSTRAEGVKIAAVMQDGPACKAGLKPGDIIISVDGKEITDSNILLSRICSAKPGDRLELTVDDMEGQTRTVSVTLETRPLMISTPCTEEISSE